MRNVKSKLSWKVYHPIHWTVDCKARGIVDR